MSSTRDTQLSETLVTQLKQAGNDLSPQLKSLLNQSIEESSASLAPEYINTIDLKSNQTLNDIPANLIGVNNPVDVVSGNLSANDLKSTINNSIGPELQNNLSGQLSGSVFNNFLNKLPTNLKSTLNLDTLKTALSGASVLALSKGLDQTFGSFANKTLSGSIPLQPVVPDIDAFFERDGADGLTNVNKSYDSAISSEAVSQAQQFDTQNRDNQEKLLTQTQGFIDPTATYPTKEYQGRSETNKLAQGDVSGTIVQQKEKDRLKGIQLPDNQSWEQPKIPFNGQYPYNKVIETESGHIIEIDDTPGCERLQVYHRSGTFIEIDASGTVVKRTKGSSYEIIDRNGYISVTGDANLSVKGAIKIHVGGDANIEVEGDTNVKCFNDITMQAAGRIDMSATEEINLHSKNINIEADEDLNVKGDSKAYIATDNMYLVANTTIYQQALGGFNIRSTENLNIQSEAGINVLGAENVNVDSSGAKVYINSDKATEATGSQYAKNANIGMIGDRKDIITESITDPVVPNFLDKFGYQAEDADNDQEAKTQENQLKQLGVTSKEEYDETQIPVESANPSSTASNIVRPSDFVLSQTYLPDSFQLSKHFNLGQLSSKAVVSHYPVVAQLGLSYGQLVYNLQAIALNICEPVLALYPNMFVTSAFRTAANSSTKSDHPRGKAVDIQFKNISKAQYFEIANKLATNLIYDKLLLEYKTYGSGLPWIHISFDIDSPKKLVLTYLNDKRYASGLTNLA